jgi:hypothetical protein
MSPLLKRHIEKGTTVGDGIVVSGSNDTRIRIGHGQPTVWSLANGWATAGDFSLIEEGIAGSRIYVKPGGNVGIGTTAPAGKLDVADSFYTGSGSIILRPQDQTIEGGQIWFTGAGANRWFVIDNYAGDFRLVTQDATSASVKVQITNAGNVGIGTTTPSSLLHVNGTLTATSKNFQIDHPLDLENKVLIHSALEGPEVAVYYRGEAQLVDGQAVINLPSYFEPLTRKEQRTVQLTPVGGWAPLYVESAVQDGRFIVKTANQGNPSQQFYWEVKAVRADVPNLVVERPKEQVPLNLADAGR